MLKLAGLDLRGLEVGVAVLPAEPEDPAELVPGEEPLVDELVDGPLVQAEVSGCGWRAELIAVFILYGPHAIRCQAALATKAASTS